VCDFVLVLSEAEGEAVRSEAVLDFSAIRPGVGVWAWF